MSFINNPNLCGHGLISISRDIWDYAQAPIGHQGTRVIEQENLFSQRVYYLNQQRNVMTIRTEFLGQRFVELLIEWVVRRVLGGLAALFAFLTLYPLEFLIKGAHHFLHLLIGPILDDGTLLGHTLTEAAARWRMVATDPLNWHLNEHGRDRRFYFMEASPVGEILFEQQPEYAWVPFEMVEWPIRRVCVNTAAIFALAVGLGLKTAHSLVRACG